MMKNVRRPSDQKLPPTPRQQINQQESETEIIEVTSNSWRNKSWRQHHSTSIEENNAVSSRNENSKILDAAYGQCFTLDNVAALSNIPTNMYNELNRAAGIFVKAMNEGSGCYNYDSSEQDSSSSDEDDLSITTQEKDDVERIAREVLLKMSLSESETLGGRQNEMSTPGKTGRSFSSSQKSTSKTTGRRTLFFRKKNKGMVPPEERISNDTRTDRSESKRRKDSVRVAPAVSDSRNRIDK